MDGADWEVAVWVDAAGELGWRGLWKWTRRHESLALMSWSSSHGRVELLPATGDEPSATARLAIHAAPRTDAVATHPPVTNQLEPSGAGMRGVGGVGGAGVRGLASSGGLASSHHGGETVRGEPSTIIALPAASSDLLLRSMRGPPSATPPNAEPKMAPEAALGTALEHRMANSPWPSAVSSAVVALGSGHVVVAGEGLVQICLWRGATGGEATAAEAVDAEAGGGASGGEAIGGAPTAGIWDTRVLRDGHEVGAACVLGSHTLLLLLLPASIPVPVRGGPAAAQRGADGPAQMVAISLHTRQTAVHGLHCLHGLNALDGLDARAGNTSATIRPGGSFWLLPSATDDEGAAAGARFALVDQTPAQPRAWVGELLHTCGTPSLTFGDEPLHVVAALGKYDLAPCAFRMLGEHVVEVI